jgi:hypothetical protein
LKYRQYETFQHQFQSAPTEIDAEWGTETPRHQRARERKKGKRKGERYFEKLFEMKSHSFRNFTGE